MSKVWSCARFAICASELERTGAPLTSVNNSETIDNGKSEVWRQVQWEISKGTTEGEVVRKLTSETQIKGHKVAASEDNPEYLAESDKTDKTSCAQTIHAEESLS